MKDIVVEEHAQNLGKAKRIFNLPGSVEIFVTIQPGSLIPFDSHFFRFLKRKQQSQRKRKDENNESKSGRHKAFCFQRHRFEEVEVRSNAYVFKWQPLTKH